ncbi:sensor histidine kinase [Megalodesulfovibrio gigas]|uniref:histidine kinase n=1 Tax=Megalodesulfovibrio gigas (strain ATCC 19364 / DSM 1382 / NCIMB 9332 / VKM B-1759) TaxID=1121448 RepID=T2GAN5_MEGG1|nr:HAMP domain-containing sensor histidine kinase [Megalodesulfovibrio gigas]AGW13239.1 putative multi-sensor hybrid histidine kinase [Megalodesulfovibrio gigas DSM 1382 = ATCC 19364]
MRIRLRPQSLLGRTSIIVVLVEALALAALGVTAVGLLSRDIDRTLEARARLPGLLMSRQLLRYESVADKAVMTNLAGNEFLNGLVVAADGHIYFASDKTFVGRNVSQLEDGLADHLAGVLDSAAAQGSVVRMKTGNLLCITPIRAFEGARPFFYALVIINTEASARLKSRLGWGFALASFGCILLTSAGLLLFFRHGVVNPLGSLEKSAQALAAGKLDEPIDTSRDDEIGSLARQFATMRDAIRAKVRELEDVNRKLTELDELKSHFLSSVSHELRTPLTSLLGFASLTRKHFRRHFLPLVGDDPNLERRSGQIMDNLQVIEAEGARLTRLINDVLDLNRIESGRRVWRDKPVRPTEAAEHAVRSTAMLFALKPEIRLLVDVPDTLPAVRADPDSLQQVLVNLLHNAVNYTELGQVQVQARQTPAAEGQPHTVQFTVQDTGPGIAPEDQGRLFQKFVQLHPHGRSAADVVVAGSSGTGLGLAICKEIVTHYDGEIWVESAPGQGSAFHFTLPIWTGPPPLVI